MAQENDKTPDEKYYELTKLGKFYRDEGNCLVFKDEANTKHHWLKNETYGEFLTKCLNA